MFLDPDNITAVQLVFSVFTVYINFVFILQFCYPEKEILLMGLCLLFFGVPMLAIGAAGIIGLITLLTYVGGVIGLL